MNWIEPRPALNSANLLTGKYYDDLIEIDIDNARVRAVQTGSAKGASPENRGMAAVAAFTEDDGEGGTRSSVLTGFGYTTLKDGTYTQIQAFGDVHECCLLGDSDVGAGGGAAGVGSIAAAMSTSSTSNTPMQAFQTNLGDVHRVLFAHIQNDVEVRKMAGSMCPKRNGCLIVSAVRDISECDVKDLSTLSPYLTCEEFWAERNLKVTGFLSEKEIRSKFGDDIDAEDYGRIAQNNHDSHFCLLMVLISGEMNPTGKSILEYCHFARWFPGRLFQQCSLEKGADGQREIMEKVKAKDTGECIVNNTAEIFTSDNTCANRKCGTNVDRMELVAAIHSADKEGREEAERKLKQQKKLNLCSGCKLVRYCSGKCQKEHWSEHKVLCRKTAPKTTTKVSK